MKDKKQIRRSEDSNSVVLRMSLLHRAMEVSPSPAPHLTDVLF